MKKLKLFLRLPSCIHYQHFVCPFKLMETNHVFICGLIVSLLFSFKVYGGGNESPGMPFGSIDDETHATKLWQVMENERLVGANANKLEPFFGGAKPHGMILEIAQKIIQVENHVGFIVVKKNYNGDGVSVKTVEENRSKYLTSITVMYQREAGYDESNQNWFWVKYKPGGTLFLKSIKGKLISLAGRIAKGKERNEDGGCIYCHSSAGGGDYIFYPDIEIPQTKTKENPKRL